VRPDASTCVDSTTTLSDGDGDDDGRAVTLGVVVVVADGVELAPGDPLTDALVLMLDVSLVLGVTLAVGDGLAAMSGSAVDACGLGFGPENTFVDPAAKMTKLLAPTFICASLTTPLSTSRLKVSLPLPAVRVQATSRTPGENAARTLLVMPVKDLAVTPYSLAMVPPAARQ
jgi:hypothetical protein